MGTDNVAVVYGTPNLLDRLMPDGYKVCRNCMGTGRIADFDDVYFLNDLYTKQCPVCNGSGFIKDGN